MPIRLVKPEYDSHKGLRSLATEVRRMHRRRMTETGRRTLCKSYHHTGKMKRTRIRNLPVHSHSATALFNTTSTDTALEMPHKATHKHWVQSHQLQISAQYWGSSWEEHRNWCPTPRMLPEDWRTSHPSHERLCTKHAVSPCFSSSYHKFVVHSYVKKYQLQSFT